MQGNEWLVDTKQDWEKLTGIGKVIREVEYPAEPTRKTIETSYYIGSVDNVIDFATAARNHWGVESMHWSLDYPRSSVIREEMPHSRFCLRCA